MYNCSALGPNSRSEIPGWNFYCNKLQMLEDLDCSGNHGFMFTIVGTGQYGVKKKISPKQTFIPTFSVYLYIYIGMYNTEQQQEKE